MRTFRVPHRGFLILDENLHPQNGRSTLSCSVLAATYKRHMDRFDVFVVMDSPTLVRKCVGFIDAWNLSLRWPPGYPILAQKVLINVETP